jgi:hypothetical protein
MKRQTYSFLITTVAAVLLLMFAAAPSAMADGKRLAKDLEGQPYITQPVDRVTIEKKTLTEVITNAGQEYSISDGTIIVGLDGHQISIRKMLVPCEAEITYSTDSSGREATRIQINLVYPDASWQWTSKNPD